MPETFQYDVFLSHSSKDKDIVRPLAERLRQDGLRVWFDEFVLKPGDNLPQKIDDGLEESRVLVLCMSANAFGSEWTQLESGTFRFRDPLNKERRFIPLRLDEVPIKDSLAQFLHINWSPEDRPDEYRKLFEACHPRVLGTAAKTEASREQIAEKAIQFDEKNINAYAFDTNGERVITGRNNDAKLWDMETGRCLRVFEGHSGGVRTVAWSGGQSPLLTGAEDNTIRIWDIQTGRCLRVLEGHTSSILSLAWSADHRRALSGGGSTDNTIRLWDVESGHCIQVLKGHESTVWSVVWSVDQRRILSGAGDNTMRLWDVDTGLCLVVFEGHSDWIRSVAWSPDGRHALSGGDDTTLRLWDVETGRCLRIFEGNVSYVGSIAWSADQHYALSGAVDHTVRIWDIESGHCLGVIQEHPDAIQTVAWGPDHHRAYSGDVSGGVRVWNFSRFLNEAQTSQAVAVRLPLGRDQIQYTNAKVLLVGDTGVGKSGLAERLVRGRFVPTKSSHARQAHVLESKVVNEPNGASLHRETILWDLAGQPAYRSVHQLSMDDAAMACVLFDARSETNPFEGPAYWSQVLDQARTNTKVKKLLVASRIDVGGLPAGRERIEAFARENGFEKLISTSANTGEGCAQLLEAIRTGIPWDEIPKVTTTRVLTAMRDYIARLKGEKSEAAVEVDHTRHARLLSIQSLHEGFAADYGEKIPLAEFIAHLQRLEASDTVSLLVFSSTGAVPRPEDMVLLDPTRVDAYSSALLVAAKDEPDGPGHLLETRVRDGKFTLDHHERISDPESERHLLWFVMEKLLSRDLALRERIKGQDYVVFPSQCTAELRFPGAASFGVTYGFAGPVRSIYARLIAHLAHYEGFKKRDFFQDAAAYRAEAGGRCLLRLCDQGRGQGELEVLYDSETPAHVRQGFLEFVGKQLEANSTPGSLTKRLAYHCANEKCGNPFEDRVVRARLTARKKNLICPICEMKTPLVDLLAPPTAASESVAAQIDNNARAGRQRMTSAFVIKAKEAEGKFDVFLSHNSKDKAAVEKIAKQLKAVGLRPWLDKWNLAGGDTLMDALEEAIKTIPCAALCFGPADVGRWHIMEIRSYVAAWANKSARMIPVILPGVEKTPDLPLFVQQTLWVDMRDWDKEESDGFYQMVCAILGRPPGDAPMKRFGVRDVAEWQRMKLS
jgi:small GTP-binding protein